VKDQKVIIIALLSVAILIGIACAAMAQNQPQPGPGQPGQPQPQPQKPRETARQMLKNYYLDGEEKEKSITWKEKPAFKLYKPGDKWHFVDLAKLHGNQSRNVQNEEQKKQVDDFFRVCKCIMHNAEIDAEARVLVGIGLGGKTIDVIAKEMEHSLKTSLKQFERIALKGKKKNGAVGFMLEYTDTPQGQEKDHQLWYVFVKNDCFYQLRVGIVDKNYEDNKKELDKIYSKWKF